MSDTRSVLSVSRGFVNDFKTVTSILETRISRSQRTGLAGESMRPLRKPLAGQSSVEVGRRSLAADGSGFDDEKVSAEAEGSSPAIAGSGLEAHFGYQAIDLKAMPLRAEETRGE